MSYKEEVQDKIRGSAERAEERIKLWEEISAAHEQGGIEQVESTLAEKMEGFKGKFEEAIEKLRKIL